MGLSLDSLLSWLRTATGRRLLILTGSVTASVFIYSVYSYSRKRRPRSQHSLTAANYTTQQSVSSTAPFRRHDSIRRRHRNSPSVTFTDGGRQSALATPHEQSFATGLENLVLAIRQWESVRADSQAGQTCQQIGVLLERAHELQQQAASLNELYVCDGTAAGTSYVPDNAMGPVPPVSGSIRRGTLSILSDDSFQSALENFCDITLREPLGLSITELELYQQGVQQVATGTVQCRVLRLANALDTDFVNCASDDEFLAKLFCVRKALETILADEQKRLAMCSAGRRMIAGLMRHANKDPEPFYACYDAMMTYLREPGVWDSIVCELTPRRVCELSFYDIVLDFVLMDAFDDLAQPPSAVFAVTRSRYLSDSLKESTLRTIVWSVLKNKRGRLQQSNGFLSRFYDISEVVSPVLAWGFLGTNQQLTDMCYYFKEQISSFVVDIFSFDRVRFTTLDELAEDVWLFCQTRAEYIEQRIDNELLPAEL